MIPGLSPEQNDALLKILSPLSKSGEKELGSGEKELGEEISPVRNEISPETSPEISPALNPPLDPMQTLANELLKKMGMVPPEVQKCALFQNISPFYPALKREIFSVQGGLKV
jgi:hypothetical protein